MFICKQIIYTIKFNCSYSRVIAAIPFTQEQDDFLLNAVKDELLESDKGDVTVVLAKKIAKFCGIIHLEQFCWNYHCKSPSFSKKHSRGDKKRNPGVSKSVWVQTCPLHQIKCHGTMKLWKMLVTNKWRIADYGVKMYVAG